MRDETANSSVCVVGDGFSEADADSRVIQGSTQQVDRFAQAGQEQPADAKTRETKKRGRGIKPVKPPTLADELDDELPPSPDPEVTKRQIRGISCCARLVLGY